MKLNTIIVGAGLTGLTVAHKLRREDPSHSLLIIDKKDAPGGAIRTHREEGFISEIGPHGFLDNNEISQGILAETGLDKEAVRAPLMDFVRYVYHKGKLNMIEQTPVKIAKAPLISWPAKFRVLGDLFKGHLAGEPTIAEWVEHRFGAAMVPYMDAAFTGTYAGDINRLRVDAVMPGVRAIEKQYGSLIRGLVAKAITKKRSGAKKSFIMPAMTSFPNGMIRLPERLAEQFSPEELLLSTGISAIERLDGGWSVTTDEGVEYHAEHLVLALPTNAALQLLSSLKAGMPQQEIPEAWIVSVIMGYKNEEIPPGFGFLTPESEHRFSLGCLFSSNMFPGRAPENHIVIETLVGGRRHPERVAMEDGSIIERATKDIEDILGLKSPCYTTVLRSKSGIPQLEEGYTDLLSWRDALVRTNPGLHVCGFGWEGIGLNDMMKTGTKVAEAIHTARTSGSSDAEAKGIYF